MIINNRNPLSFLLTCSALLTVALTPFNASAKKLDWSKVPYTHFSDQEPLRDFLTELAATQKTPIVISEKVDSVVSGYYREMPPEEIFLNVAKANGLLWYFDGDTLFVNREDELQTGSVSLSHASASEFTSSLERLGVLDHHYHWVSSDVDQMVYFKGPEQFVTAVLEMSKVLDKKQTTPSIYKWVDSRGVTHFSSNRPKKFATSNNIKIIEKDKGLVLLGEPNIQE
ncbi:MAG: Unknown protein [uncultured Thiotrichaceae bacterium]|uniref:DUF4124 domain-containing protein n=1 Tax=uncultured Thiotrichaceae bacterium TaxID=298394 RepID=A0A6S6TL27_9GAMM|nr:MAG: Unknown protein [uncultured Thiotrichaceae bacterium]